MTETTEGPNLYQLNILVALNRLGKSIYAGTVAPQEVARRRKANKVARAKRRKNRSK